MQQIHILRKDENLEKLKNMYCNDNLTIQNSDTFGDIIYLKKENKDFILVNNFKHKALKKVENIEEVYQLEKDFDVKFDPRIAGCQVVVLIKKEGIKHIVKPMENIFEIADKYGECVENIIDKNKLKTKKLFVGQMLQI